MTGWINIVGDGSEEIKQPVSPEATVEEGRLNIKAIHIEAHIYPTTMQEVPAGKDELTAIENFTTEIRALAKKHLPGGRSVIKITEEREWN